MIIIRRRLIFWLVKAYIKKRGKTILIYFGIGLFVFFLLRWLLGYIIFQYRTYNTETIGMVGAYTLDNLPTTILYKISRGLTTIASDGTAKSDIAKSWKIEDNGKSYIFELKNDIYFTDKTKLTSDEINYSFKDVVVERPNKRTIVFKHKESYSPFLLTISKPIFRKGFVGVNEYRVKKIKLNGGFVESIDIEDSSRKKRILYQFYSTYDALKNAFVMADVSKAVDLPDVTYKRTTFYDFKNSIVDKKVNYKQLVTLFYNTKDKNLSSKSLREAFYYSLPDKFEKGERTYSSFPPQSFASQNGIVSAQQDFSHAKLLIDKFKTENPNAKLSLKLHTLSRYKDVAENIAKVLDEMGVRVEIIETNSIPDNFELFLGEFFTSPDPDQYVLWHTDQENNISRYSNLRIDKILEDGRQIYNLDERKKIYADFQKYIAADPPASFLFFPYTYDVTRR